MHIVVNPTAFQGERVIQRYALQVLVQNGCGRFRPFEVVKSVSLIILAVKENVLVFSAYECVRQVDRLSAFEVILRARY